jgi:hypothetical protein
MKLLGRFNIMTSLNGRLAAPVEDELAALRRRHAELCGQLETERAKAARVEAELLTGKAEVGDVTTARQRCAALGDAVSALQGQIDIKMGECAAQRRADEIGRILAELGERTRALEARRVRCSALHDEGVEALRSIAGRMAEESAAYTQERREMTGMRARLRELRAAAGAHTGGAGEAEIELPTGRVFTPRIGVVVDPLSASVCRAFNGAVQQRAGAARAAAMGDVPQAYGPEGFREAWAEAKGVEGRGG